MNLTRKQLDALLEMLALTRAEELTCHECAARLSEFAENHLAGKSISEGLRAIEHHLQLCNQCREEFQSLLEALQE